MDAVTSRSLKRKFEEVDPGSPISTPKDSDDEISNSDSADSCDSINAPTTTGLIRKLFSGMWLWACFIFVWLEGHFQDLTLMALLLSLGWGCHMPSVSYPGKPCLARFTSAL